MEKAHNVYMLCVDFGWADLGSWGSLFDLANKDERERVLKNNEAMLYECSGNVIALNNPKLSSRYPRAKRLHRGRVWKRIIDL